ncbi:MAG: HEAT repeat domain-containing protein [Desulfobulbaceae bacterium]|nr:HEAT repeat domain-containing protein [Desulfobulbaceae bacterium]
MSARKIKQHVLSLLATEDLQDILRQLNTLPVKDVVNVLFSAVCRGEDLIHWNGVHCMGVYVARLAGQDMEEARIVMRRMLWSLNDESGGIGWGIPEAMAEVMVNHDGLAREYIHMLISYMREDGKELFQQGNFLEHESLQQGLLRGIGRLAEKKPDMLLARGVVEDILPYLDSRDPSVRGFASRCLGLLQAGGAVDRIERLVDDPAPVTLYEEGRISATTVGRMAAAALAGIRRQSECA